MGVQTEESTLEHWLQAYINEKGGVPRNALQICAFARNRGASLKYREVCDALASSKIMEDAEKIDVSRCSPREWRLQSPGVGSTMEDCSSWSTSAGVSEGQSSSQVAGKEARFRCDSPERQLHPAKLRFSWLLQLGCETSTKVELLYSRRTGKKQVLIDGKTLHKTFQQCFEWSWQHPESEVLIILQSDHDQHELFCEGLAPTTTAVSRENDSIDSIKIFGSEVSAAGSSIASSRPVLSPRASLSKPSTEPAPALRASSSAPELRFEASPCPNASPVVQIDLCPHADPLRSPVPRLTLPTNESRSPQPKGSVDVIPAPPVETTQSMPEPSSSPVIHSQFRHSRSTPIFNKVKEYLSASRTVPSKRTTIATAQRPSGSVKKTVSAFEAHSPTSGSSPSSKIASPPSTTGIVVSPGSPVASRQQAVVEKIQSVAALVRARLSASLSPAKRPTGTVVLEPLFEESSSSANGRFHMVSRDPGSQGRTLVRNSSAPGDISNIEDFSNMGSIVKMNSVGVSNKVTGKHTSRQPIAEASVGMSSKIPVVPKLQMGEVLKNRYEDGRRMSMPPSMSQAHQTNDEGATTSLAQKSLMQMAHAQNRFLAAKSRPVTWTPRGSSPTRANVNTPDPGRSATPLHALSSRHQIVHATNLPPSQLWSYAPSLSPLSPSASQISPTRARFSNAPGGYPPGASLARVLLNSQVQPSGRMVVPQSSSSVTTQHFQQYSTDSSGARSVGVPPPENGVPQFLAGQGSYTPPVPKSQNGNVNGTTPIVQRRIRRTTAPPSQ